MTLFVTKKLQRNLTYFVYFNDWTGEILSIGTQKRDDTAACFIETQSDIAAQIIRGEATDFEYLVDITDFANSSIIHKNEVLRIRQQEDQLFLIPKFHMNQWTIRIKLYTENKKILFEVNEEFLRNLVSFNVSNQIKVDKPTLLEFYLTLKDNPDYLIETYQLDLGELIEHKSCVIDVPELTRHANLSSFNFLTRRYFQNYYFEIINDSYIENKPAERNTKRLKWNWVSNDEIERIEFVQENNSLVITSLISPQQIDNAGIKENYMDFYVVGKTPDHYLQTIRVDMSKLRMGQQLKLIMNHDIDNVNIMYKNEKLHISKRKLDVVNK